MAARDAGISFTTFCDWQTRFPDFAEAVKEGESLSCAFWDEKGLNNLTSKDFSVSLYALMRANLHGWKQKTETEQKHSGGMKLDLSIKPRAWHKLGAVKLERVVALLDEVDALTD